MKCQLVAFSAARNQQLDTLSCVPEKALVLKGALTMSRRGRSQDPLWTVFTLSMIIGNLGTGWKPHKCYESDSCDAKAFQKMVAVDPALQFLLL